MKSKRKKYKKSVFGNGSRILYLACSKYIKINMELFFTETSNPIAYSLMITKEQNLEILD
jgi:hypothetical protein